MSTIRDRILDYLRQHPEGASDAELTAALALKNHAQANQRCRELEAAGLIERRHGQGSIRNVASVAARTTPAEAAAPRPTAAVTKPSIPPEAQPDAHHQFWFWEGNVQSAVIQRLVMQGYKIVSVADTAARQQGKDIVAAKDGRTLWVTVKGYPAGTDKTNPSTQARVWFSSAVFDIVVWRGEDATADLVLALPDYATYRHLAERVRWLQPVARFSFLWVQQDGRVEADTVIHSS